MSHKMLRPLIVKLSVFGYFPPNETSTTTYRYIIIIHNRFQY